jgi:1,4-dihydroxy-2-naphthoyl-CoA hydrolase
MSEDDFSAVLNENTGGFNRAMGISFVRATTEEVVAEWTVGPQHLQPYGIVHGGVHSGVIETLCSAGAALSAMPRGLAVVGVENHTTFLHAVRAGKLTCTARPLSRGRRSHAWQGDIHDERGKLVATGRVRLLCVEADAALAGQTIEIVP